MDASEATVTINRLMQSAFDEADARAEQKLEERLKEAEDRLTMAELPPPPRAHKGPGTAIVL